jgi:hypothetical protein
MQNMNDQFRSDIQITEVLCKDTKSNYTLEKLSQSSRDAALLQSLVTHCSDDSDEPSCNVVVNYFELCS